ncbi:flagellin [Oligoflexia bacterium]|nr:flagellin [Oligoflexia bacterium]
MTRISENQIARAILTDIIRNREAVAKYTEEVSSGKKVLDPGDSKQAGTVAQFQDSLGKIQSYRDRIAISEAFVAYQENILSESSELLIRAKEIATQGANETNSETERAQLAQEVYEIREHMVTLANSKYQGRYIYSGARDNTPAYSPANPPYTVPASGLAADRYTYDIVAPGRLLSRTVQVTEDLSVTVNTPGNGVFDEAIQALERLGRALGGYQTNPAVGAPDGTGVAYTFPADYDLQTADIQNVMGLLDTARERDLMPERTNLAGRLRRLQTAESILEVSEVTAREVLAQLQDADLIVSASRLTEAQTALQASLTVTAQVLRQSIMDYL